MSNSHFPSRRREEQRPKRDIVQLGKPVVTRRDLSSSTGDCDCNYPTGVNDIGSVTECSQCPEGSPVGWQAAGFQDELSLPLCPLVHDALGCVWTCTSTDGDGVSITATLSLDDPDFAILTIDAGLGDVVEYRKMKSMWGCNCANKMELKCPSVPISRTDLPCTICLTPMHVLDLECCANVPMPQQVSAEIVQLNNLGSLQAIHGVVLTLDFVANRPAISGVSAGWSGYMGSSALCSQPPEPTIFVGPGCTGTREYKALKIAIVCDTGKVGNTNDVHFGFDIETVQTCPSPTGPITSATTNQILMYFRSDIFFLSGIIQLPCDMNIGYVIGRDHLTPPPSYLPGTILAGNRQDPCYNGTDSVPDGRMQFGVIFTV
tara:strand:- start:206 stop:1330 length:1125 start_codon:yes stop_codon:yes gene_type:complete